MGDEVQSPAGSPTTDTRHDDVDQKARLSQLVNLASAKEATKDYAGAADLYSEASELQAELNGDMAPENADVLYSYGKCLYHVGVDKSEVLGTKIATQGINESTGPSTSKQPDQPAGEPSKSSLIADAIAQSTGNGGPSSSKSVDRTAAASKPLFQFAGDENFDVSDEEGDNENGQEDGAPEEEEDEFSNAFEILDLSRILYDRKLGTLEEETVKNKDKIRKVRERLADIYDLQAEISLEGERFLDAASDLEASLKIKQELYSLEDPIIAECHYKLSLALEFASVTRSGEDQEVTEVDSGVREQAANHMETAIKSCRARISKEQARIDTIDAENKEEVAKIKRNVDEVKEIVSDMEQRLIDLRRPPVSIPTSEKQNDSQSVKLDDLSKIANDLSGLVKKKKPASGEESKPPETESQKGKGKRPLESPQPAEEEPKQRKIDE